MTMCRHGDQYLVSMITNTFVFETQQSLYHNKVTLNLTPEKKLSNQACNRKMDFCVLKLNESHLVALKYHAMDVSAFLLSQFTSYVNDFLGPAGYKFF